MQRWSESSVCSPAQGPPECWWPGRGRWTLSGWLWVSGPQAGSTMRTSLLRWGCDPQVRKERREWGAKSRNIESDLWRGWGCRAPAKPGVAMQVGQSPCDRHPLRCKGALGEVSGKHTAIHPDMETSRTPSTVWGYLFMWESVQLVKSICPSHLSYSHFPATSFNFSLKGAVGP